MVSNVTFHVQLVCRYDGGGERESNAFEASVLRAASTLHVSSGYGLFRRMTGVGKSSRAGAGAGDGDDEHHQVARPEIILQGSADGRHWKDLSFTHKPGDPTSAPTWVAPHQPTW